MSSAGAAHEQRESGDYIDSEELKPGAEIETPANIFYVCKHCIFNNCEIFLSPDIDPDDVKDIGILAAREGLKKHLQALFEEIEVVQRELMGFSEE